MKKSFTLIELLVVVAIIGVLAAVGTPIFQGFLQDAKINASKENIDRLALYFQSEVYKCEFGAKYIFITPGATPWFKCSWNKSRRSSNISGGYLTRLIANEYTNPYNTSKSALRFGYGLCPHDATEGEIYADRLVTIVGDSVKLVTKISSASGACPTDSGVYYSKIIYME